MHDSTELRRLWDGINAVWRKELSELRAERDALRVEVKRLVGLVNLDDALLEVEAQRLEIDGYWAAKQVWDKQRAELRDERDALKDELECAETERDMFRQLLGQFLDLAMVCEPAYKGPMP